MSISAVSFSDRQRPDPAQMRAQMFKQADANGDGSISKDEFETMMQNAPQPPGADSSATASADDLFTQIDTDGDGKISETENDAYLSARDQAMGVQGGPPPPPPLDGSSGVQGLTGTTDLMQSLLQALQNSTDSSASSSTTSTASTTSTTASASTTAATDSSTTEETVKQKLMQELLAQLQAQNSQYAATWATGKQAASTVNVFSATA